MQHKNDSPSVHIWLLRSSSLYPYPLQMQIKFSAVPEHEFSFPHMLIAVSLCIQVARKETKSKLTFGKSNLSDIMNKFCKYFNFCLLKQLPKVIRIKATHAAPLRMKLPHVSSLVFSCNFRIIFIAENF